MTLTAHFELFSFMMDANTVKKIVDVNNDCLESVFELLEFQDLINLAEANKHLSVAAEIVFARKLKKRSITVEIGISFVLPDITIYDKEVCIRSPLLAVRVIRHFGQSISGIHLNIGTSSSLRKKFFVHVNEYCYKTLNILSIFGNYSAIFAAVEHSFENVEKFTSYMGTIESGCEHIIRLFPRVRQLTFTDNDILNWKYIFQTFPHLDTFTLNYRKKRIPDFIQCDNIKTMTTLNPHIRSFTLYSFQYNPDIWGLINEHLKNLKEIGVFYTPEHADCFKGAPILFNNIETFIVRCYPGTIIPNPIEVFSFKHLKNIRMMCFKRQIEVWVDFVSAHPTIEDVVIKLLESSPLSITRRYLEPVRQKLNKISENTKTISLQVGGEVFIGCKTCNDSIGQIGIGCHRTNEDLWNFLEYHQWISKFTVEFRNKMSKSLYDLERFSKNIRQNKKYIMTKNCIYIDYPHVDFEKCE